MKTIVKYLGLPLCGGLLLAYLAWVFIASPRMTEPLAVKPASAIKPITENVKSCYFFFTEVRDLLFPVLKSLN
jgi:hypothetical protein